MLSHGPTFLKSSPYDVQWLQSRLEIILMLNFLLVVTPMCSGNCVFVLMSITGNNPYITYVKLFVRVGLFYVWRPEILEHTNSMKCG